MFNLVGNSNENGGNHTIKEILQQQEMWKKLDDYNTQLSEVRNIILSSNIKKVYLCGAGSSEYIGNSVFRYLKNLNSEFEFISVPTTSIVSNPKHYFSNDEEIIMISFARSGNSPESVESLILANTYAKNVIHIAITCNKDGQLANVKGVFAIVLPPETNDLSFAMTSSFSTMMLCVLRIFNPSILTNFNFDINKVIKLVESFEFLNKDRFVFLASDDANGIAEESALKLLELASGRLVSSFYTPLGFRHGPKSLINSSTATIMFLSGNLFTRKYEYDLVKELVSDNRGNTVIVIDCLDDSKFKLNVNDYYYCNIDAKFGNDIELNFVYLVFAQLFSVMQALKLNITPDNPSFDSSVNRVVQGVIIHKLGDN